MRRCLLWLLAVFVVLPAAPAQAQHQAPPDPSVVTASGAVLWDPADRRVLHGKEADVARPMASTTKMMTVLLALEAGAGDEELVVSSRAAAVGQIGGVATLDLSAGQRLPVGSVLAGLMLRSGNDGAVAVAEHVAGTEDAFVALMNARAEELGLDHTHFVNATGLTDDPGHHASPTDLARLAEEAMAYPQFREWSAARTLQPEGLAPMVNRNELLWRYRGATGVKTGYTALAGLCLVASAERGGRRLIAVVLDSSDSFTDAAALLDYGFAAFRRAEPVRRGDRVSSYRWAGAQARLVASSGLARTVQADDPVVLRTVLEPGLRRPVPKGTRAGQLQLVVDGRVRDQTPLLVGRAVRAYRPTSPAATVGAALQEAARTFALLRPIEQPVSTGRRGG